VVATAVAVAALALPGAGTAATTTTIPGIVDIYTNLGYQQAAAAGTGIVLTSSGEILTNNHVIRGATSIKVIVLDTGKSYKASVVGYTVDHDIAVLQLTNASGLTPAPLGTSTSVKVGDAVTTLGNAGGAGGAPSAASGKIVGLGKSITARDDSGGSEKLTGLFETDAALQPGDSGGPMVSADGKVIGVDTAASTGFTYQGSSSRGFAIPINRATALAAQMVAGKASASVHIGPTAFLGVQVQSSSPYYQQGAPSSGLFVGGVVTGSPLAKVGIKQGDIVTKFDGMALATPAKLTALVVTKSPGDSVEVRWVDQYGTAHVATIKLASGPPQ
jgi:S1-C subfamily serine protease